MPSLLFNRVGHFFSSFNPNASFNVRIREVPVIDEVPVTDEAEARLTVRINATEDELYKTRQELEDEKTRSRKWERRAVVASADLAAAKSGTDDIDRIQKRIEALEDEKIELEHRANRLNRMLAVAEEQRGIAIARLAGFTGGIEDAQEENRILKGTVKALRDEIDTMTECLHAEIEELEEQLRESENRENAYLERVKFLEGNVDDAFIEKRIVEDKLSTAQSQLLDLNADRCLVNVMAAEKEQLEERIEQLSQTAEKVPSLENNVQQLRAETREGKRKLEGVRKLLVALKIKNDKLVDKAKEKEQYGESMAQMFADMKKECERLRRERDEKAHLYECMVETHEKSRAQQEKTVEALHADLETKAKETSVYETNLEKMHVECETKNLKIQSYFDSYNKIAHVMKLNMASEGVQPDFETLESSLSNAVNQMHCSEAKVSAQSKELELLRKENQDNAKNANKLNLELTRAKQAHTEINERIGVIKGDNVRLRKRGADLESEVDKLEKAKEALQRRTDELAVENDNLERKIAQATTNSKTLQDDRDALHAEMKSMQACIAAERKDITSKLAERSANFASLENELRDARETYLTAAKQFEPQRLLLNRRLTTLEHRKAVAEQGLVQKERVVKDSVARVDELTKKCKLLEEENDGLKEAGNMRVLCDDNGDVIVLREMLAESEGERERLSALVNQMQRARGERRLSSSSVSSDDVDMARRVQELEMTLEEEAKKKEAQEQQLSEAEHNRESLKRQVTNLEKTAKEKELEAEKLRGEMASIYSRMRKMASVSLPAGAEELLEEEDDLRRLKEIREASRKEENNRGERENREEVREWRKLPAQKRKLRMGVVENKTRFRVREERAPTSYA